MTTTFSRRAGVSWRSIGAAIVGGLLGGLFLSEIPVLGTIFGALIGAAVGMWLAEYADKRSVGRAFAAVRTYMVGTFLSSVFELALAARHGRHLCGARAPDEGTPGDCLCERQSGRLRRPCPLGAARRLPGGCRRRRAPLPGHRAASPHVVVGDLDSLPPETVAALAAQGVQIERHPPAKDQTDLELAIDRALREGAQEIAAAGRPGRAPGSNAGQPADPGPTRVASAPSPWRKGNRSCRFCAAARHLTLPIPVGSTVSAIPLSPAVTGITYTGLAYPLDERHPRMGSTRGISNVVAETPATIAITSGLLLVVYYNSFS